MRVYQDLNRRSVGEVFDMFEHSKQNKSLSKCLVEVALMELWL